jgi:Ca-activated chloride channel homolog
MKGCTTSTPLVHQRFRRGSAERVAVGRLQRSSRRCWRRWRNDRSASAARPVVPRRPGWRRHVPATLVLLALTCLGLAAARPEMTLRLPYDRATVMVAIDTSGSMAATDVPPNRLEAAKAAAVAFVDDLPDTVNVGIVSFAGNSVALSAPTTDHAQVQEQIGSLDLGGRHGDRRSGLQLARSAGADDRAS